jgi:hypothetical protein
LKASTTSRRSRELTVAAASDEPLIANHPEIPADMALQGFDAIRAYTTDPGRIFRGK